MKRQDAKTKQNTITVEPPDNLTLRNIYRTSPKSRAAPV